MFAALRTLNYISIFATSERIKHGSVESAGNVASEKWAGFLLTGYRKPHPTMCLSLQRNCAENRFMSRTMTVPLSTATIKSITSGYKRT